LFLIEKSLALPATPKHGSSKAKQIFARRKEEDEEVSDFLAPLSVRWRAPTTRKEIAREN
jgi:hypothetical protein